MRSLRSGLLIAIVLASPLANAQTKLEQVTFDDAIHRALLQNPGAKAAMDEVHHAEALVDEARAAYLPTFTLNATVTQLDGDRKLQDRIVQAATGETGNVQLAVPIIAGSRWMQTHEAQDQVEVAKLSEKDVERQLAVATAKAFLAVVSSHRLIEVATLAVETAKEHEAYANDRLKGGVGNELDELRAKQELASSRAQLANATTSLVRAEEALGVMVATDGPIDVQGEPKLEAPTSITPALDEAKTKRTDVLAANERVTAATRAKADTWADYLPLLSLVAQPFFQNPATITQPEVGWQAQLVLSLPIYDGGLRSARAHDLAAAESAAQAEYEGALRQATSDVRAAFASVKQSDEALADSREAADAAEKTLHITDIAFKAGATSSLELIDAQEGARQADQNAVLAEDASRQARLDLLAASGRFP